MGTDFSKRWEFYNSRAIKGSLLNILDTPTAKQRKEAYARSFPRKAIEKNEPQIHQKIDRFLVLLQEAGTNKHPVDLSMDIRCLTADVTVGYAYREDFGGLSARNFMHPVIKVGEILFVYAQWRLYFPRIFAALDT